MEKAIFTNMELRNLQFHNTKNGEEYCTFSISSLKPKRNGVFFKGFCQAFGGMCAEMKRLKITDSSIVDLTCDFSPYPKKRGDETDYAMSYVVKDIAYSDYVVKKEKQQPQTKEDEVTKQRNTDFYKLANLLSGPNVFAQ